MRLNRGFLTGLRRWVPMWASVALVACSEDATGPRPVPTAIAIVTGADQTGTVGQALDTALTVFVTDKFGDPVPGVLVRFSARSGSLAPVAETTSPSGQAHTTWSLPTLAGEYRATATAAGLDSLIFRGLAVPAAPATISVVAGDSSTAPVANAADSTVTVVVQDGYGNPVGGVKVSFTPMARSGATAPTVTRSDSSGRARTVWTLGTEAELQGLTVRVDSLRALRVYSRALYRPAIPGPGLADAPNRESWGGDAVVAEQSGSTSPLPVRHSAPAIRCWQNALGIIELALDTAQTGWSPGRAAGPGTCNGEVLVF